MFKLGPTKQPTVNKIDHDNVKLLPYIIKK